MCFYFLSWLLNFNDSIVIRNDRNKKCCIRKGPKLVIAGKKPHENRKKRKMAEDSAPPSSTSPPEASSNNNNNKKEEKKEPEETPSQKLVRIARLYFLLGFAFLPWMWFANALMLYQYRNKPNVPPQVLYYRNWSAICFAIASMIFVLYVILARTALVDVVPWVIKPGIESYRQGGLFSSATLSKESAN